MIVHLRSVLPVVLPGLAVFLWYLRTRRQFTVGRLIAVAGFATYLLLVSKYTLFPLWFDSAYVEEFRAQTELLDGVNLVPFKGWSLRYLTSIQGWGNVALGVPFGFAYPFVMPVAGWRQLARYGAGFAAAIELTQLAVSLFYGFAYRVVDINDVLLNVTGAMIGYALLRAVAFFYQAITGHRRGGARRSAQSFREHIELTLLEHSRRGRVDS